MCQLKSSSSVSDKSDFSRMLTRRLVRPSSSPQRLTLKYGYSRDRLSDRRIHRQIEGGTRSAHVFVYTVRNERQKTNKAKEPRKTAIHSSVRSAAQRFRSCSPNYSSPDAASTTESGKACVKDVLRTGRPSSQRTGGNSLIRSGSHAIRAKSSPSHGPGTATRRISWRLGRACSRGRKAPCVGREFSPSSLMDRRPFSFIATTAEVFDRTSRNRRRHPLRFAHVKPVPYPRAVVIDPRFAVWLLP